MENGNFAHQQESGNFVVMDNGTRFYLHVIGLHSQSWEQHPVADESDNQTIQ